VLGRADSNHRLLDPEFFVARAQPTIELAAGRPNLAGETVALPELAMEGRFAVALARRGPRTLREFINAALEALTRT
jgi:hypothetical protein